MGCAVYVQVLEENVQARRDESGSEPLRLAYFSVPEHNISEPSAEEEPIEDSNLLKDRTQKAQQPTPTASSSLCWNLVRFTPQMRQLQ